MSFRPAVLAMVGVFSSAAASASTAIPYPSADAQRAEDRGVLAPAARAAAMTVTLPLKLRNMAGAEALLESLCDETSAQFRQFLTVAEFEAQFAPADADVAAAIAYLAANGLGAERAGATTLRVTGAAAAVERVFQVSLHAYRVPVTATTAEFEYRAPAAAPSVPAEISSIVGGVLGLSNRPAFVPHNRRHAPTLAGAQRPGSIAGLIHLPGSLTVADFSKYYDVQPLAAKNITGAGRTLAIVTLASFTPSDAFAYWKAVHLKVDSNRIGIVKIDGGAGAPSDLSGSVETTLDVEQAGGLAPAANIIVYEAPNTTQAFLDAFVAAVNSNRAESISTSWGSFEWFDDLANGFVIDRRTGRRASALQAFHEVFLQAALQGQSVFAAAGDAGAYDANRHALPPNFSLALSVDSPASDSYVTAAGGTTLPGAQVFALPKGTLTIDIPHERVWGWDYLMPLCQDLGYEPAACGIFPVGSGGGVSFEFALPAYQQQLAGIQKTQPDQAFVDQELIPPKTLVAMPAYYSGRNVPDISFDADPNTGYIVYYTSNVNGFSLQTFYGGTSFVAPQLNGLTALFGQYVGARLGLLNGPLYRLARARGSYHGKGAPLRAIAYGNNDFFYGRDGYSPAAGVGTLDVANFAEALKKSH
ncbi:MAG: S53 family peptidase [Pseudomonadota bacterium]|nr:S53 family peptidase [Pseudomonadota bacterium]